MSKNASLSRSAKRSYRLNTLRSLKRLVPPLFPCEHSSVGTLLWVESSVEVKRNSQKKVYQQQGCEGGAVLIETGDIADLDGIGFGGFYLDGVGEVNYSVFVSGVPLFEIDRIGSYSDKNTIMEVDAVALELGGGVVSGACGGLHGLTGG